MCVCVSAVLKVSIQTPLVSHTPTAAPRLTHSHLLSAIWIIDWHKPYHNKPNMASECSLCLNACFHLLVCVQMLSRAAHGLKQQERHTDTEYPQSNYNQTCRISNFPQILGQLTAHVFSSSLCSRPSMQSYFSMHSVRMQIYQARP